jgi:allantoinase
MTLRGVGGAEGLSRLAEWLSEAPASLAGMERDKGAIQAGADADFAVFDPDARWTVGEPDLHFRHKISPYLEADLQGRIVETWLRGQRIYSSGQVEARPVGKEWVRR